MVKEGSLTINPDLQVISFGTGLEWMLGYSADEVYGKEVTFLAANGDPGELKALIESVRTGGAVIGHKMRLLRKDSSVFEVFLSIYPLRDRAGDLYSYMLIVNSEKSAQRPALLSEEFQRIFRFSNDAVAITDAHGTIIDVNQTFLDTYGYEREEVLGKNPRVFKSHHSTKELYERMWKDILDPEKGYWRGEIINVTREKTEIPVLLSINAIKDEDGEIRNFLGIAFNMSRQKELDRTNRMYIDYIIHDMRGPLTSIMANSELLLLQLGTAVPEKSKKKLEVILACSQKLHNMTSDVLDFSRAQNGSLVIKNEIARFPQILRNAFMPFENSEKKLYINGFLADEYVPEDREIEADVSKLERIIYNLLSNAFKNAFSEVRVQVEFTQDSLALTVTDDGKGISALQAERIFDAFYQTEDGIKTGGAGLGLSIVKSFVEAHDGRVWVEPGHGRGAVFGITMPLKSKHRNFLI